jgi:hypothetical protein
MKRGIIILILIISFLFLVSADNSTNSNCTPSWNCTTWSNCIEKYQIRTCIETNNCTLQTETERPREIQLCGYICKPSWRCTDWQPENCPKETKTQIRDCWDVRNCGTSEGKPEGTKSCTIYFGWTFNLVVAIIIIFIFGGILLIRERRKRLKEK